MSITINYQFSATLWQHSAAGGWYFVSLPIELAAEIRELLKTQEEGWGRMKTKAKIGETCWDTGLWFDSKLETYLLPIKAEIRKKEKIEIGSVLNVVILI